MKTFIVTEAKPLKNPLLECRYQVTAFNSGGSLDSEWCGKKSEAIDCANKVLEKNLDVDYCVIYNLLNKNIEPVKILRDGIAG